MRPGGLRVHLVSLDLLGCTLGIVGFVRSRSFKWSAPWVSSGSSGFAGFSLGVVVGLVLDRWVH